MNTTHETINQFLKAGTPVFCYCIYRIEGKIYGHKIGWKHWSEAIKDHLVHFDLAGKNARYIVVADDRSISRADAINFAKAVYEGRTKTYSVDLNNVTSQPKK